MSVHIERYVMMGWSFPYRPFKDKYEKLEPHFAKYRADDGGDVHVVYDGMSGEYVIVGRILAATKRDEDFEGVINLTTQGVTSSITVPLRSAALRLLSECELDGDEAVLAIAATAPQFLIVTHYT